MKKERKWLKILLPMGLCVLAAAILAAVWHTEEPEQAPAVLEQLTQLREEKTVSNEEYRFFAGLPGNEKLSGEQLCQEIGRIHAEFYLGSQLGLCEAFDYGTFRYRTEAENTDRAMKRLNGQMYYGPDSFTEEGYFSYLHSRLRGDLVTWLADHRDEAMIESAEAFYQAHPESFTGVTSVTYQVTDRGVTQEHTVDSSVFKTLGHSDPSLMDFLSQAQPGEETVLTDGSDRQVKLVNVTTEQLTFRENERFAVEAWLLQEALNQLISAIADNSQLVF